MDVDVERLLVDELEGRMDDVERELDEKSATDPVVVAGWTAGGGFATELVEVVVATPLTENMLKKPSPLQFSVTFARSGTNATVAETRIFDAKRGNRSAQKLAQNLSAILK